MTRGANDEKQRTEFVVRRAPYSFGETRAHLRIEVDKRHVGDLGLGKEVVAAVTPGTHTLSVSYQNVIYSTISREIAAGGGLVFWVVRTPMSTAVSASHPELMFEIVSDRQFNETVQEQPTFSALRRWLALLSGIAFALWYYSVAARGYFENHGEMVLSLGVGWSLGGVFIIGAVSLTYLRRSSSRHRS